MNLGEIRGLVETALGRALAPATTNTFIDSAKRDLDRLVNRPNPRRAIKQLAIGDYLVTLGSDLRSIHHVWALHADFTTSRSKLEKRSYDELKVLYPNPTATTSRGVPLIWTYSYFGTIQKNMYIDSADYNVDYADFLAQDPSRTFAIEVGPSVDKTYSLELLGNGYTLALEGDSDVNWWSGNHPMTLVNMTLARMEWFFRNNASGQDFFTQVKSDLQSIYFDYVESDVDDIPSEMRG